MSRFIHWPLLATIVGLGFLGLYWTRGGRWAAFAGILWLAYSLYELGMRLRWLCSGECNIRVDLLLIYPVLIGFSLAGIVSTVRRRS